MLSKQIKELQLEIESNIYYLNNGGCIQFAYFFSKKLQKLKISHQIVYCNHYHLYEEDIRNEGVNHVMIHIKNIGYIDGYRTYRYKKDLKYEYIFKNIFVDLNRLRNRVGIWNSMYDKSQNKTLNKLINKHIWL